MPRSRPDDAALPVRLAETRRKEVLRLLRAAEKAGSWAAVSSLVLQLRKADEVVVIARRHADAIKASTGATLTPTEAAAALEEAVLQAPLKVRYAIYQRLLATNPDWAE